MEAAVPGVERDTKRRREGDQVNDVAGQAGLNDEWSRDLDQATHVRLSGARHQMLGDHADGVLDKVEVERFLSWRHQALFVERSQRNRQTPGAVLIGSRS
ncbi:MAG TPA: hypothetical protein VGV93_03000 [Acidimicrobiales bacterium]|nr:hypothetical protein [Acidimicrobiales bacterium]